MECIKLLKNNKFK
uniref:Uncharacterized protein n=1 Tax=Lepeophtheirus salmonis TaxID=72036 RepID=A0A0K2V5B8_LEPSM